MAGKIIMWIVCFGCGILFFWIGIYAKKLQKPMWFYSGTEVDAAKITDIASYNHENGIMWRLYSLWYFAAGIAEIWSAAVSLIFLILGCTAGIILLVSTYHRIYKKYQVS